MNTPVAAVEVFQVEEMDRRISEREEQQITGLSRTTRWRLTNEGRYPQKGSLGPWLSEVLLFANDPDNYSAGGAEVPKSTISIRKVKRRAVKRRVAKQPSSDDQQQSSPTNRAVI